MVSISKTWLNILAETVKYPIDKRKDTSFSQMERVNVIVSFKKIHAHTQFFIHKIYEEKQLM